MTKQDSSSPALWRLIREIGTDTIRVARASDNDQDVTLTTTNPGAVVEALVRILRDRSEDDELCLQAALMLASGDDLAPLQLVLPALVPMLKGSTRSAYWAGCALEIMAPAPGNEDLTGIPSHPVASLTRITVRYPSVSDLAFEIIQGWAGEASSEPQRRNTADLVTELRERAQDQEAAALVVGFAKERTEFLWARDDVIGGPAGDLEGEEGLVEKLNGLVQAGGEASAHLLVEYRDEEWAEKYMITLMAGFRDSARAAGMQVGKIETGPPPPKTPLPNPR